jgi:DNA-directed RNA polymerase subunit RPC12/RpoP
MERITWNIGYRCARCGKEAFGKNAEDAKLNWNEMIRREQNERKQSDMETD